MKHKTIKEKKVEKTSIIIEGDITTKVVENRQKKSDGTETVSQVKTSVRTEDWFNVIKTELTPPFECVVPAMPTGSRIAAMAKTGDRSVFIVEMSPTIRNLKVDFGEGNKLYKLSFPFVYLVQRFVGQEANGNPLIYYRNEPIFGEGDPLLRPNLPNIYDNYSVCWGSSNAAISSQPINIKLANICQIFWQSQFNKDLAGNFWEPARSLEGHPKSCEEGEKKTGEDPSFILKIKWLPTDKTVADILKWGVQK